MQCRVAFNMYPLTYRKTVETVYESFPQLYAVLSFALVVETVDPEKHQKETQVYFSHNLSIKLAAQPPFDIFWRTDQEGLANQLLLEQQRPLP